MTLIIAVVNHDTAVLMADRRLTCNGRLMDDESTKATIMTFDDARLGMGYTGLARTRGFSTQEWLFQSLVDIQKSFYTVDSGLAELTNRCTALWKTFSSQSVGLTLLLAGYTYSPEGMASPCCVEISNYNPDLTVRAGFRMRKITPSATGVVWAAVGTTRGIASDDKTTLQALSAHGAPAHAIEAKARDVLQRAADNAKSKGLVGGQGNSCVILDSTNAVMRSTYFSATPSRVMYSADVVFRGGPAACGMQLVVGPDAPHVVVPRAGSNTPCPCGSEVKYKRCHGRVKYPFLPIQVALRMNVGRVAAGSYFIAESRGAIVT